MAVKIEYKGENVDEAINTACANLNLSREQLNIEVISPGSAGIFGLCKRKAVISVSTKHDNETTTATAPALVRTDKLTPDSLPNHGIPEPTRNKDLSHKNDRPVTTPSPETLTQIEDILSQLLQLLHFNTELNLELENNRILAKADGSDNRGIIGKEGEIIDAIQYLMRKIISHTFPEKIFFSMDVGNYRQTRQKELEGRARSTAKQVQETEKSQTITALNPAERRIIHITLQDNPSVNSVSIGDGLFKKIKIYIPGKGKKHPTYRPRKGQGRKQNS